MFRPLDPTVRYLTDCGLETTLLLVDGCPLESAAVFPLVGTVEGRARLTRYFLAHAAIASERGMGFVFEAPTRCANSECGALLGYSQDALDRLNEEAIAFMRCLAQRSDSKAPLIAGQVGACNPLYIAGEWMSADEAAMMHCPQLRVFVRSGADMVMGSSLTYTDEAVGIAKVCAHLRLPLALSFATGRNGRLPSGQPLSQAIEEVDERTAGTVSFYVIDCPHPSYVIETLDGATARRVAGIRTNAAQAHAEPGTADVLDLGDPSRLGTDYCKVRARLPGLALFGGSSVTASALQPALLARHRPRPIHA